MKILSADTAMKIWSAHREIEVSTKLRDQLIEAKSRDAVPDLRDHFGRVRGLQLGVPCSDNGHRLFDVQPSLAKCVIDAHIAAKKAELEALSEQARLELTESATATPETVQA